jgi:hypothetical protein
VTQFLRVLLPKLAPLQYTNGGPIILFQVWFFSIFEVLKQKIIFSMKLLRKYIYLFRFLLIISIFDCVFFWWKDWEWIWELWIWWRIP